MLRAASQRDVTINPVHACVCTLDSEKIERSTIMSEQKCARARLNSVRKNSVYGQDLQ